MSAPNGPATCSASPEPRKRPVPMVPAIFFLSGIGRATITSSTNSNHLHMALLQLALDLVKVMGVELVAGIGSDHIVLFPFFDGRGVLFLVIWRRGWGERGGGHVLARLEGRGERGTTGCWWAQASGMEKTQVREESMNMWTVLI